MVYSGNKEAKYQRINAFKLWCWRRLLKVPWTAGKSNQSIWRMINPEYSVEGLMLKLKLQYFGHLLQTGDSLEKSLIRERLRAEEEGIRGLDGWTASPMQWTWTWANSRRWWGTGRPGVLLSMSDKESDMTGQLNNNRSKIYKRLFSYFSYVWSSKICLASAL